MRFGPDHGRVDSPRIYVVSGDDIKPLPVKASLLLGVAQGDLEQAEGFLDIGGGLAGPGTG